MYSFLRFVPKNHLSFALGALARIPLPRPVAAALIRGYAGFFSVDLEECARPLGSFRSLGEFFVRDLKPGLRPIGRGVVSPVDGTLRQAGPIHAGRIPQIKGKDYSLADFVRDEELARAVNDGYFISLYLSPRDYHHVHSPFDGVVTRITVIPGRLWPVNDWSIRSIDDLFSVNERVVLHVEIGSRKAAVVLVGATNVGRITVPFHPVTTNPGWALLPFGRPALQQIALEEPVAIRRGDRIGTFHLGSSVVVLLEREAFPIEPPEITATRRVRYGETIWLE